MLTDPMDRILGDSAAVETMRAFGRRAATVDAPVLLLGESGTGKGVLARAIHDASARARHSFVAVNCAAVPEALFESEFFGHVRGAFTGAQYAHKGLFEQADRGTLFLDEVGELPPASQAKLLTAVEDRLVRKLGGERAAPVDIRIIAATACALQQRVADGRFRNDLFHRLRILTFTLPPLRMRTGDARIIARELLAVYGERYQRPHVCLDAESIALLDTHDWPGNVRELANVIEAAVVSAPGDVVRIDPDLLRDPCPAPVAIRADASGDSISSDMIERALRECRGNRTRAAAVLGIARTTLWKRMKQLQPDRSNNVTKRSSNDD